MYVTLKLFPSTSVVKGSLFSVKISLMGYDQQENIFMSSASYIINEFIYKNRHGMKKNVLLGVHFLLHSKQAIN
jgi:hypothetical protein